MTLFYLLAFLLLTIAALFIVVPFVRFRQLAASNVITADWYQQRQDELATELAAGKFTEQEYQDAVTELKLTTKDELLEKQSEQQKTIGLRYHKLKLASVAFVMVMVVAGYYYQGQWQSIDKWQQTLETMPELSRKVLQDSANPVSTQELVDFALGLRTKLAKEQDAIGWMLLGRVLMALSDFDGAIDAFAKSYKMNAANIGNLVSYAQALQAKGEEYELNKSISIIQQAMMLDPENPTAVILFAEGHMLLKDYALAKQAFNQVLPVLEANDPRKAAIEERLAYIAGQQVETSSTALILAKVNIFYDDALNLDAFSHVFVFIRPIGQAMPLVVKKLLLNGPIATVTLAESDVMVQGTDVSTRADLELVVRLSKDGNAPLSQGEIEVIEKINLQNGTEFSVTVK